MDMVKYTGSAFLKVGDVKEAPRRVIIDAIEIGKFDKPNVILDDGTKLSLNATNTRALVAAYGKDSNGWINKEIELFAGEIEYQGAPKAVILVRPISPPTKTNGAAAPKDPGPDKSSDMDDEIPF
jgi:hypothetical protein